MEIWEWLSSARNNYTQKSPLSSCRASPMSPGLPASKLLVLALSKAILTIVFVTVLRRPANKPDAQLPESATVV